MKTILCGTDFSESARIAASAAAALADRLDAPLELVHALELRGDDADSFREVSLAAERKMETSSSGSAERGARSP